MYKRRYKTAVRYSPPWRRGERSSRYIVHEPPNYLKKWWRFMDAAYFFRLGYVRHLKAVQQIVSDVFGVLVYAIGVGLAVYLYGWHVMPVVIDTLF